MIKQQNIKIGFLLAILTAFMWGVVAIAIKYTLVAIDPYTIAWYRFLISAVCLTAWLTYKKQFPRFVIFKKRRRFIMLMIAGFGLLGNFALFASTVQYLPAAASQIVAQFGIVVFMISSVFIFKEKLKVAQIIGIVLLLIGLLLFFNNNLTTIFNDGSQYGIGIWLGILASISWTCYALAQKVLLAKLRAEQLLWLIYLFCCIFLFPLASPAKITQASTGQIIALLFCGFNTIIAYGALVAAMEQWQAAQVSAITTLAPLFALIASDILALLWPESFAMLHLNIIGYIGAVIVVFGAMSATVGHYIWQPQKGFIIFNRKKGE